MGAAGSLASSRNPLGSGAHLHPSHRGKEDGTLQIAVAQQGGEPCHHLLPQQGQNRLLSAGPHITCHSPPTTAETRAPHTELPGQETPAMATSQSHCLSPWAMCCGELSSVRDAM